MTLDELIGARLAFRPAAWFTWGCYAQSPLAEALEYED